MCLRDSSCGGGHHPSDHDRQFGFAEFVTDLPSSTSAFVLRRSTSFLPGFNGEEAMKLRIWRFFAIAALVFCCFAGAQALAQNAYITNLGVPPDFFGTVSVIDTTSNTVAATIPVGSAPFGVAVSPDGSTVYVANEFDNTVSV